MADVKISQLPSASTPLSGAELVPVVQSGQTVQTTVGAVTSQTTFLQTGTGAVLRSGQDKMRDIINAKDFGVVGDGIADDTAALQRAINAAAGRTLVLSGVFRVTAPASPTAPALTITASDTYLVGQGTARIVASGAWASGQAVLEVRGPGALPSTTLTAAITSSSTTFQVASAANIAPGTFVQISSNVLSGTYTRSGTLITVTRTNHGVPNGASIRLQFNTGTATTGTYTVTVVDANTFTCTDAVSGTTSGAVTWFEYWSGIVGDSGFQPVNKKELNCVRSVSGTIITPEWGFADTYSITGYSVNVIPYQFINGIKIEGVQFYCTPGNGNNNTTNNSPAAVKTFCVEDFAFTNCRIENFQFAALEVELTHNSRVTNNEFVGRDLADPTNLPTISVWFYGPTYNGATDWVFANNTCQYLRRAVDAGGTSGFPISRNGVVANNTAISCQNGYGTHFAQNIVFSNNLAVKCQSGIYFRGKDAFIVGNVLESIANSPSAGVVVTGSDPGGVYVDNPSSGRLIIANNLLKTNVKGIFIRNDIDSAVIDGNTIWNGNDHGITFEAKRVQDVIVSNNHIDITNRSASRYGIYMFNKYDYSEILADITIIGNRLKNATDGIRIEAPVVEANAASNIIMKNNTIDAGAGPDGTQRGFRATKGFFDANIVFRDNLYGNPTVTGGIAPGITLDLGATTGFTSAPDIGDNAFWNYNQQVIAFAANTNLQSRLVTAVGQRIINSAPAPSGYMGWVCTSAGVVGSLATVNGVAVTGDITSGTDQLTVSSLNNASIFVGAYLTIAGAGVAGAGLVLVAVDPAT
jgi:hypothetical protein